MGKVKSKIECPHCLKWVTIDVYKRDHGKTRATCYYNRAIALYREDDEIKYAGRDKAVLSMAGVTRQLPISKPYYWTPVGQGCCGESCYKTIVQDKHGTWVDDTGGDVCSQRGCKVIPHEPNGRTQWRKEEIVRFETCAPKWAVELARKLMDDQKLIVRFGKFKLEKRSMYPRLQQQMHEAGIKEKGRKAVIPIELRAKIIEVAAKNAMTREFMSDDLDVVLTIIRDAL